MTDKKGVTLVEIMFSAVVIALVMIGVLTILAHTVSMSKRVDLQYASINIAKSRLERAREIVEEGNVAFALLSTMNETGPGTVVNTDGIADGNGDFQRTTTVTTPFGGDSRLAEVSITVVYKYLGQWRSAAGITVTTVLTSVQG